MEERRFQSSVEAQRRLRGWSQAELAGRARTSRAAVSAIERGRNVPSTEVALALAQAFQLKVEDLFHIMDPIEESRWAWEPRRTPCRFLRASILGRTLLYPVDDSVPSPGLHDGVYTGTDFELRSSAQAEGTLVIAGCDPALKLLSSELEKASAFRLIVITRSSRKALELLRDRLVHIAGVHLAAARSLWGNARVVREILGGGYRLLRHARWEEGVALSPGLKLRSVRALLRSNLRWIGREEGSGARACLDQVLDEGRIARDRLRYTAFNHLAVVEAIRGGWAQAGVCPRLFAHEAGLDFIEVQREDYDLCYPEELDGDPRLSELTKVVRSPSYRRALRDLEGYDTRSTGEVHGVQ